jgi:hypothetical protein
VPDEPARGPESALPPVAARVLAFVAILVGGLCGGIIGAAVVDVQCAGDCTTEASIGGLVSALLGALGVAVVAVLALRAMGEWRTIQHGQASDRAYVFHAEPGRLPPPSTPPADEPAGELESGNGQNRG